MTSRYPHRGIKDRRVTQILHQANKTYYMTDKENMKVRILLLCTSCTAFYMTYLVTKYGNNPLRISYLQYI